MRYHSVGDGIESWHCFSAGAHYDPDNVSFGPITGLDEHLVPPGAGFDWHGHRGAHIATWLLEGALRHEDATGVERLVQPGSLLVQSAASGFRHRETNASDTDPLRFVQITILDESIAESSVAVRPQPVDVGPVRVSVARGNLTVDGGEPTLVMVLRGFYLDEGVVRHRPGDCLRLGVDDQCFLAGDGQLLVLDLLSP